MIYVILCGGVYKTNVPRQLWEIDGEPIVQRTIRLLKKCGVPKSNIYISTHDERFEKFGVSIIHHENNFNYADEKSYWLDAFPKIDDSVCYIFGDVVFSENAIRQIVKYNTNGIQFFASGKPFDLRYPKIWQEPFAFKVVDTERFFKCVEQAKQWQDEGKFDRIPISWELWQVIQETPINHVIQDYYIINDYTCDVDDVNDLRKMQTIIAKEKMLWPDT